MSQKLQGLGENISVQEADYLAWDIYHKSYELTEAFELVSPPQFHNFLVNVGIREKGLCYHFSDALYLYLKSQRYESFDFHLVGANIGEYWSEHNALVVVAKNCISEKCIQNNGIVIDAWRNSGEVYYSRFNEDMHYHWKHRSERCKNSL
ncbi:hypothetical protein PGH07_04100 [Sulfurovum sp. zt1-1]|uniref:Transglutaminase-like domain-containing protein n=1 Tax=Sulfurovum zhangzhouensis TaxID=3019067 RepID=A0ABT7QWY7_9BACT|nr:hypothetical protein [Sulfurovum zhangzhouensis]MDM5271350.1 hypothetical protein [Sulfurovum zhangzhouensis]